MVTCDQALVWINYQIDGCLSKEDNAVLQEHLRSCAECRAVFEAYTAIQDSLLSYEEEPPAGFAGQVMIRVRNEKQNKRRVNRGLMAGIACAAALALVIGFSGVTGLFSAKSESDSAMAMNASTASAQEAPRAGKPTDGGTNADYATTADSVAPENAGIPESAADALEADCDCAPDVVFVPNAEDYAVVVTVENKEELEAYASALVFEYGPEGEWCIVSMALAEKIRDNVPSAKYYENFDPAPGDEALILILP